MIHFASPELETGGTVAAPLLPASVKVDLGWAGTHRCCFHQVCGETCNESDYKPSVNEGVGGWGCSERLKPGKSRFLVSLIMFSECWRTPHGEQLPHRPANLG